MIFRLGFIPTAPLQCLIMGNIKHDIPFTFQIIQMRRKIKGGYAQFITPAIINDFTAGY